MESRRDPDGTKNTDDMAARRFWQGYLRPPFALDAREQRRHLDEGNTDAVARGARRAALDEWFEQNGERYVLTQEQVDELVRFIDGKGPRPHFVWPYVPGGLGTEQERQDHALALAERNQPPARPDADGRYPGQEPQGRFARADDSGFTPDRR